MMRTRNTRPITPIMKCLLQECVKRETSNQPPLGSYYTKSAKGLFERGLICIKEYEVNSKRFIGFESTERGREYLQYLNQLETSTSQ